MRPSPEHPEVGRSFASRVRRVTPNVLSTLRLLLAVCFPGAASAWRPAIVVVAGFTDLADGFIARRYGVTSWIGGILDAIADKAFVLCVLATLAAEGRLAVWVVAVLLVRDLVVFGIAGYAVARRDWAAFRAMPSRPLGKAATASMFLLFLALLIPPEQSALGNVVLTVTACLSVAAGTDYMVRLAQASFRSATINASTPNRADRA